MADAQSLWPHKAPKSCHFAIPSRVPELVCSLTPEASDQLNVSQGTDSHVVQDKARLFPPLWSPS